MRDDVIRVSAVVIRDAVGAVLTVRKRGTERFMLPGGKPEPGESAADAAVRECAEEVGAVVDAARLRLLGTFRADAANEDGRTVEAVVFEHPPVAVTGHAAEIAETRWLDPAADPLPADVAPLLRLHVLPALSGAR